jgi:class 3 adenylate cyclase/tetratricopeptide (TPR) repeat protein
VQLINSLFTPAIGAIEAVGGEIGWFAGDAMGVLFDRELTTDTQAVAALAQASRLIAALPPVDVDGRGVRLDAKVGVAAGPVRWSSLDGDHVTTWFGGDAIDLAVAAEHHAVPGDLIVHESVNFDAGDQAAPGFTRCRATVVADPGDRATSQTRASQTTQASQNSLGERRDLRYQPPKIARLATVAGIGALAEHRPVTVFFASMPESTHDPAQLLEIRAAIAQQGGMISGVTEGDKGAVVLAVFGAPVSHPERADRALQAASKIRELIGGVRIGITSGRVFAGPVGSASRWDYTTIGDRVNVAARLMQAAAPGEILVDVGTIHDSHRRVDVGPERALALKGKSADEIAIPLLSIAERDQTVILGASRTSFVGREQDVTALVAALAGEQSLIVVRGDAGSGKSRLVDHLIGLASSGRFVVTWLEQSDVGRPFQLWRRLFERLVGSDRRVFDALSEDRRNDPRLPVASSILGVELSDTTLVANLSATARFEVMVSVVDDLLGDLINGHDVVIEDLHWADDQSLELLRRLAPRLYGRGVHLLAASRPEERVDSLSEVAFVHPLGDLVPDALGELASDRWTSAFGRPPHDNLVRVLVERGAGSPLFVEQLVELAHDFGVDPSVEEWPSELMFPTNLTDVVLSRLDRLPDRAGLVANLASVLGRTFSTDDVVGSFGHSHDSSSLITGLDLLIDAGFVVPGAPNHFHHALFAESAYERMPFGQRSEFHRDVLLHLERVHPDPKVVANDLARHAEQTDDEGRKRSYFLLAGDEAMRAYVSGVASRWYNQLLDLLPEADRGAIHFKLGRLHMSSGEYVAAEGQLARAAPSLSGSDLIAAQTDRAEALISGGSTNEGLALLDSLARELEAVGDWTNLRVVMNQTAVGCAMLSDVARLAQIEAKWSELAMAEGSKKALGGPLERLIPLYRMRGELSKARSLVVSARDASLLRGDLYRAARWTADTAGYAFLFKDFRTALDELGKASELMKRVGNRTDRITFVVLNEVLLREEIGDRDGAIRLAMATLEEALRIDLRVPLTDLCRVIGTISEDRGWLRRAVLCAENVNRSLEMRAAYLDLARLEAENGDGNFARRVLEAFPTGNATFGEALDRLSIRLACSGPVSDFESLEEISVLKAQVRDDAEVAELSAFLSLVYGSANERAFAVEACRNAFERFPSARLDAAVFRLTGRRFELPELPEVQATCWEPTQATGIAARIDDFLEVQDSSEAKSRCDQILSDLIAAAR